MLVPKECLCYDYCKWIALAFIQREKGGSTKMAKGDEWELSIRRLLGNSSRRVTAQRTLLLELLRQTPGHMDAEELHRRARGQNAKMSLSTVYRNLQLFKELGLVQEHHFIEEHHHYEVKSEAEHQHLLCTGCGKVIEFVCPMSQTLKEDAAKKYDFDIFDVEVRMVGLCAECRRKEGKRKGKGYG